MANWRTWTLPNRPRHANVTTQLSTSISAAGNLPAFTADRRKRTTWFEPCLHSLMHLECEQCLCACVLVTKNNHIIYAWTRQALFPRDPGSAGFWIARCGKNNAKSIKAYQGFVDSCMLCIIVELRTPAMPFGLGAFVAVKLATLRWQRRFDQGWECREAEGPEQQREAECVIKPPEKQSAAGTEKNRRADSKHAFAYDKC